MQVSSARHSRPYARRRLTPVPTRGTPGDLIDTFRATLVKLPEVWDLAIGLIILQQPARTTLILTLPVRGCFRGFLRSKGFEFLDLDSGKRYEGTIAKQLRAAMPTDFELVLGRTSARYLADIEITRRGDREKYILPATTS